MKFLEFFTILSSFYFSFNQSYTQCSDKYPECKMWKEQQLCSMESYKEYMMMTCPITCDFCRGDSSSASSTSTTTSHVPEYQTPQLQNIPSTTKHYDYNETDYKPSEVHQENMTTPTVTTIPQAMKLIQSLSQMISQTSAKKSAKLGSAEFSPARIGEIQRVVGKKMLDTHKKHSLNIPLTLRENVDFNYDDMEEPKIETKDHTLRMIIQNRKRSKIAKEKLKKRHQKKALPKKGKKGVKTNSKKKQFHQRPISKQYSPQIPPGANQQNTNIQPTKPKDLQSEGQDTSNYDQSQNDPNTDQSRTDPNTDQSQNDLNTDQSQTYPNTDQSQDNAGEDDSQEDTDNDQPSPQDDSEADSGSQSQSNQNKNEQSSNSGDSNSHQSSQNQPPQGSASPQQPSPSNPSSSSQSAVNFIQNPQQGSTTAYSQFLQPTTQPPNANYVIVSSYSDCDPSQDCGIKYSLVILQQFDQALYDHNTAQFKALKGNLVQDLTVDLGSDAIVSNVSFEPVSVGPQQNHSSTKAHFIIHGDLSNIPALEDKVNSGNVNGLKVRPNSLVSE